MIGVRRSGKSTILKQVLKKLIDNHNVKPQNTLYINFEDPQLINLSDVNEIIKLLDDFSNISDDRSKKYVVFDEIQNVVNWELLVRNLVDERPDLKIYITGSSASLIGRELGTKLSGRYIKTEIYPLSYEESIRFTKNKNVLDFVNNGGFPNVLISEDIFRLDILKDYFDSILVRDISVRFNIRNEFKLRQLALYLFANNSKLASSYKLSKYIGVSSDTILKYFDYIQDAYLGFFIPKYAASLRKQEYNPKKFYCIDTGMQKAVSFSLLDNNGKNLENNVFLELKRTGKDLYYWEEDQEVDFVLKDGIQAVYPINVAFTIKDKNTREREISGLIEVMEKLNITESFLVTLNDKQEIISTDVGKIKVIKFKNLQNILV